MSDVEETLGREAEQRPRIGAIAVAAGVLTLGGNLLQLSIQRGLTDPDDALISFPEALGAAAAGQAPVDPSLTARSVVALGDKLVPLLGAAAIQCVAVVFAVLALLYLDRATRARQPDLPRTARMAAIAAAVAYPIGHMLWQGAQVFGARSFADSEDQTRRAAEEAVRSPAGDVGQLLELLGGFSLGLAFVLVALNAMRVGLLTRMWGILGVIVGVMEIVRFDAPQLLRTVWLIFAGLIILGRLPGGPLPAWQSGRAEPWPTQQQLREQRAAVAGGGSVPVSAARGDEAERRGDAGYQPGQARKKRKRRR